MRDDEGETIITIVPVVRLVIVGIKVAAVIAIRVEQFRIAVRIMRTAAQITAPRLLQRLYFIRHHNALAVRTKYLYLCKYFCPTPA